MSSYTQLGQLVRVCVSSCVDFGQMSKVSKPPSQKCRNLKTDAETEKSTFIAKAFFFEVTFIARSHFSSLRSHFHSQKLLLITQKSLSQLEVTSHHLEVTFIARSYFLSLRSHFHSHSQRSLHLEVTFIARSYFLSHRNHYQSYKLLVITYKSRHSQKLLYITLKSLSQL